MQIEKLLTRIVLSLVVGTTLAGSVFLFAAEDPRDGSKPAETSTASTTKGDAQENAPSADIASLKKRVAEQQAQIEQLLRSVEQLQEKIGGANRAQAPEPAAGEHGVRPAGGEASRAHAPEPEAGGDAAQVTSLTPMLPKASSAAGQPDLSAPLGAPVPPTAAAAPNPQEKQPEEVSPLQLHVGSAAITPVGFMDFTSVFRSRDNGSGIGTNFGSIPMLPVGAAAGSTTAAGNLTEFRENMQNSRIGFRVDADVHDAHVIGYMEADFLGNNPTNVAVTSNSNTLRSRLYWVDLRRGSWEVLGGQTWSLITPGRNGISPLPADVFYTQDMDVNYQAGLFWGRIPEFRIVYHHPSGKAHLAFAIDSPEQYVGGSGGAGTTAFPSALSATYQTEFNIGTNALAVPNVAPDLIAKLVLEPVKRFHFELGGIERNFKAWIPKVAATATTTGTTAATTTTEGGGGFLNVNFELFKGFKILTNNFWSDGGGRYIFGEAPDLIAKADGTLSLIHADSTVTGFEYTHQNSMIYAYYGGIYIGRNVAYDTTTAHPAYVGYGAPVSSSITATIASGQNKSIQEGTFGLIQTFWKNPKYGALSLITQYSYLDRNPWYVPAGAPKDAHLSMAFVDLRYTLPGSAPTLGKF